MEGEIGVLQVEKRIRNRVKRQMEKTQREYYLNEQLKAIQKELGEGEDGRDEMAELEERINKTKFSKEARDKAVGRTEKAQEHEPDVGRGDGGAQLPRLAAVGAMAQPHQDQARYQGRREGPQRRPFRAGKGQGTHPRISRGPAAHEEDEGSDPVPGRRAGGRQDLAWQVGRARDRTEFRAHVAWRRARRGRDSRPSADLYRLDAGQGPARG